MNDLLKKLKIKPPHQFLCVQAPADFAAKISKDVQECSFSDDARQPFDSVHWFVKSKADVDTGLDKIMAIISPGLPVWVYFPKGSSGIQTDLTRDAGWETMLTNNDIRRLSLISFDETWATFCFRLKTDKDRAEDAKPKEERLIFQYADSATKTLRLPEDLQSILEKHPTEKALFDALSFSHRREYVEWVINAKQAATRQNRLEGTLEKLRKGLKNPAGR